MCYYIMVICIVILYIIYDRELTTIEDNYAKNYVEKTYCDCPCAGCPSQGNVDGECDYCMDCIRYEFNTNFEQYRDGIITFDEYVENIEHIKGLLDELRWKTMEF